MHHNKFPFLISASFALSVSLVFSGAVQSDEAAGNSVEAAESSSDHDAIRILADQGDANAQLNLGDNFYFGQGVEQNFAEAARWYRMAAEQGLADAQFRLGLIVPFR